MQVKKIFSVHPRRTKNSTLRSLIILGLEWEEPVVGVSNVSASNFLNRLDALP